MPSIPVVLKHALGGESQPHYLKVPHENYRNNGDYLRDQVEVLREKKRPSWEIFFFFFHKPEKIIFETPIEVKLRGAFPRFIVSSTEDACACVRGYLKYIVGACLFLVTRFSLKYLSCVSSKRLTKNFIFFSIHFFFFYRAGPRLYVLKRVKRRVVPPNANTFFLFKLHNQTLPAEAWLAEKGIPVAWSGNYILCTKQKTVDHDFVWTVGR